MTKEKIHSALTSVTSRLERFSELNWLGLKARTIAVCAIYSASLKGFFKLSIHFYSFGDLRSKYRSSMATRLFHLVLQSINR